MTDKKLTNEEEAVLWRLARRHLATKHLTPAVSSELAERLRAQLPTAQPNETLSDLIRRASAENRPSAQVEPFRPKQDRRLQPLTEFVRLAADTRETETPLPDGDLESIDGRFRLRVSATGEQVELFIQALGFAADEFAGCRIGLAGPREDDEPLAVMALDQDGDGTCRIKDTASLRRALLKPTLVLID